MTSREWIFDLPITKPLSLNSRQHYMVKAREVAALRAAAGWAARAARIPPLDFAEVELHYAPKTQRVRDVDNLVATSKPAVDALRDIGVLKGDDPRFVRHLMPVIDPPTRRAGRLYVVVRDLSAPTPQEGP